MKFSSRTKIGTAIVLLIVFLIILNLTNLSKEIRNIFYLISAPIQRVFWRAGARISDFFETVKEIGDLKTERDLLKAENQKLLNELFLLEELKTVNKILRDALAIGLQKDFSLILAQTISKDPFEDVILINRGLKHGISEGMTVITQQRALVGRVVEVYKNFSKVMLISNKKSSFDVKVLSLSELNSDKKEEVHGIVKGKGNLLILLDFIPYEKEIRQGDVVRTTTLGGIFPKNLLVGQITEIKRNDIQPFQQAEIEPAFDIKKIDTLFVITNHIGVIQSLE